MLQHEFESRVKIQVSAQEYAAIEQVYMASDVEKDEFCKLWAKMNRLRIAKAVAQQKAEAQFKALPIEEQVLVKMLELAQLKANETGCTLPVSDIKIDADIVRSYSEADAFTVYLVLRETGAAITHTFTDAVKEKHSFSNPAGTVIYQFFGNRNLNHGYCMKDHDPHSKRTF